MFEERGRRDEEGEEVREGGGGSREYGEGRRQEGSRRVSESRKALIIAGRGWNSVKIPMIINGRGGNSRKIPMILDGGVCELALSLFNPSAAGTNKNSMPRAVVLFVMVCRRVILSTSDMLAT